MGAHGNLLEDKPENCKVLKVNNPILTSTDLLRIKYMNVPGFKVSTVSINYYKNTSLEKAIDRVFLSYYFEVQTGRITGIFDMRGLVQEVNEYYDFIIIPGFHTPDWAKGAVMYQIYTDRFCNGDSSNDVLTNEYCYIGEPVHRVEDWGRYPAQMDVREFYGGDLYPATRYLYKTL